MLKYLLLTLLLVTAPLKASQAKTVYVHEEEISQAIKREAMEKIGESEIDLEFFGGQTSFALEEAQKIKIMVSNAQFEELQNKFSAEVEIFADGKSVVKTSLQGKYYILGEIYIPNTNINKGETITADKLRTVRVRINRIKPQHLVDKDKLIDKEAKRNLREGKIISDKDVGRVILIKKGEVVNSIYQSDIMQISAKAEALGDGYKGDKVEVRNTKSKKTFYGTVIDANTVLVEPQ